MKEDIFTQEYVQKYLYRLLCNIQNVETTQNSIKDE